MAKRAKETSPAGNHEERFLKAFDDYADALFRHAVIRLSDRERAIELVHDTFTKAWTYVRMGENEIESYRPFLYKVLGNLIIDEYRRRKTESLDAILENDGPDTGKFPELQESSLNEVLTSLDATMVLERITELPPLYREMLTLRFVDGLGPKEIASLIEESENVVSVRINRGINMLRTIVNKQKGT